MCLYFTFVYRVVLERELKDFVVPAMMAGESDGKCSSDAVSIASYTLTEEMLTEEETTHFSHHIDSRCMGKGEANGRRASSEGKMGHKVTVVGEVEGREEMEVVRGDVMKEMLATGGETMAEEVTAVDVIKNQGVEEEVIVGVEEMELCETTVKFEASSTATVNVNNSSAVANLKTNEGSGNYYS